MHREQLTERELNDALRDWGMWGDGNAVFDAWCKWNDYRVLPFAGGWLDQPEWIRDDFNTLDLLEAWHMLQKDKPAAPKLSIFDKLKGI